VGLQESTERLTVLVSGCHSPTRGVHRVKCGGVHADKPYLTPPTNDHWLQAIIVLFDEVSLWLETWHNLIVRGHFLLRELLLCVQILVWLVSLRLLFHQVLPLGILQVTSALSVEVRQILELLQLLLLWRLHGPEVCSATIQVPPLFGYEVVLLHVHDRARRRMDMVCKIEAVGRNWIWVKLSNQTLVKNLRMWIILRIRCEELRFLVVDRDSLGHESWRPQPLNANETLWFLKLLVASIVVATMVVKYAILTLVFALVAIWVLLGLQVIFLCAFCCQERRSTHKNLIYLWTLIINGWTLTEAAKTADGGCLDAVDDLWICHGLPGHSLDVHYQLLEQRVRFVWCTFLL